METLHFDYQLRDGVATTTNAIRVLEIEGIKITASVVAAARTRNGID